MLKKTLTNKLDCKRNGERKFERRGAWKIIRQIIFVRSLFRSLYFTQNSSECVTWWWYVCVCAYGHALNYSSSSFIRIYSSLIICNFERTIYKTIDYMCTVRTHIHSHSLTRTHKETGQFPFYECIRVCFQRFLLNASKYQKNMCKKVPSKSEAHST